MKLIQVNTLDEVIDQLEVYIEDCIQTQNRMGYFSTLYLEVTKKVNRSWWIFRVLDLISLRFDELLVGFSLIKARESAWNYAKQLQNEDKVDKALEEMETLTLSFSNILIKPKGLIINTIIWINHLCEPKSVSKLIKTIR